MPSPEKRSRRPEYRRSQRVLLMVHELHKQGYQHLRICPYMAPSGMAWRCAITPVTNILTTNGALIDEFDDCALYSTAMENEYFDWTDARKDTARQLAAKFIERFPAIVAASEGTDWLYAGWYVEMLGFAERDHFPVAFSDSLNEIEYLAKDDTGRKLLFPPPGLAQPETRQ